MNARDNSAVPAANGTQLRMDAPSGLDLNPRPPQAVRVSRRVGVILIVIAASVLGLFAYGGYKRQQRQATEIADRNVPKRVAPATAAGAEIAKAVPSGDLPIAPTNRSQLADSGALQPPPDSVSSGGSSQARQTVPIRPANSAQPISATPTAAPPPSPEQLRAAAAYEREQQAVLAPTTARDSFGNANPPTEAAAAPQLASLIQSLAEQNSGPTTAERKPAEGDQPEHAESPKETFVSNFRAEHTQDYLNSTRTAPRSPYEIKAGWEIPAVLEQALNSDLPGDVKALVASNVYDTASGRYILIPQGCRLVGAYNSRLDYGQDGVQVIWNRLMFPDGSSIDLSGMIGQDAGGFAGFRDKVDRHYKRLIGFAVLSSLFSAASEISQNQNRSLLTYPTPGQVAGAAVGQEASELGAQITRRNLNVQPTVKIPIGYRFNVRVNRDILFDAPYRSLARK